MRRTLDVFTNPTLTSPLTFGLHRPVIAFPADVATWDDAALRQALAHEIEHVKRGDWAICLASRVACALYWFHPLTWIVRRRLGLETERACDDAVLRNAERDAYAEQLVVVARRMSDSDPVGVLSMAARSDLSVRVRAVLDARQARGPVGILWKAAATITAIGAVAAIGPLDTVAARAEGQGGIAASIDPALRFGVASVRPNDGTDPSRGFGFTLESGRVRLRNQTLRTIISVAYSQPFGLFVPDERISGGPEWLGTERFTIEGRAERAITSAEAGAMLRALLAQRFQLQIRVEPRQQPVYALVRVFPDRLGPALRPTDGECTRCGIGGGAGTYLLTGAPMALLAGTLTELTGRPVFDRTGLAGAFDGTLTWTPSPLESNPYREPGAATAPLDVGASIFTSLEEQFGLRLVSDRGLVDYLVIERAERPTPNDAPEADGAAAAQTFDVASIRRNTGPASGQTIRQQGNTFIASNVTARDLIETAYAIQTSDQISGGPAWLASERFDVEARPRASSSWPDHLAMLQTLLAERFRLVLRRETRSAPLYSLTRSGTLKLKPAADCPTSADCFGFATRPGQIVARRAPMARVAGVLSGPRSGRRVVDDTGLDGVYDFELRWTPGPGQIPAGPGPDPLPIDPEAPSLFIALEEQLGLKLVPATGPLDHFIVERIERPTEN
jgi:uncharacterized protein (TIGR03435 family)